MMLTIESLNANDEKLLSLHRNWFKHNIDNLGINTADEEALSPAVVLDLIQNMIEADAGKKIEPTKLEALGVGFGDVLVAEIPELEWVAIEDEEGRELALRWRQTSVLLHPINDLSRRIEDYVEVDVVHLFDGLKASIYDALEDIA